MKKKRYEELAKCLEEKIDRGEWEVGDQLPGEIELACMYGVGRSTVRETLNLLQEKGMIVKKNGSGSYVKARSMALDNPLLRLNSIGEMIRTAGYVPSSIWYRLRHLTADEEMAARLDLEPGERVVVMMRGREADRIPVAFSCNVFPEKYVGDHFDAGVEGRLFSALSEKCGIEIHRAETRILGVNLKNRWDRLAERFLQSSMVVLNQLHYDSEGRKIFYSIDYLNTDIIDLSLTREVSE